MKAKDYIAKLAAGSTQEEVITAFVGETAELIKKRSEKSTGLSAFSARDGALREQKQKWAAVASKGNLSVVFDDILSAHLTEVKTQQDKWKNKKEEILSEATSAAAYTPKVSKAKLKGLPGRAVADRLAAIDITLERRN